MRTYFCIALHTVASLLLLSSAFGEDNSTSDITIDLKGEISTLSAEQRALILETENGDIYAPQLVPMGDETIVVPIRNNLEDSDKRLDTTLTERQIYFARGEVSDEETRVFQWMPLESFDSVSAVRSPDIVTTDEIRNDEPSLGVQLQQNQFGTVDEMNLSDFYSNEKLKLIDGLLRDLIIREKSTDPSDTPAHSVYDGLVSNELLAQYLAQYLIFSKSGCVSAQRKFRSIIEETFVNSKSVSALRKLFSDGGTEINDEAKVVAANFDEECLEPWNTTSTDAKKFRAISDRMVVITYGGEPFCGGVRINRRLVLTARHCFYRPRNGHKNLHFSNWPQNQKFYRVFVLNDLSRGFKIQSIPDERNNAFGVKSDNIFLGLMDDANLSDPDLSSTLKNDSATLLKPLLLVGYYLFHQPDLFFSNEAYSTSWQSGIRITDGGYCRVFDVSKDGACFRHGCQSLPFFSGGPVFGLEEDASSDGLPTLQLLGIHSRGGDDQTCSPFVVSSDQLLSGGGGLAAMANVILGN